MSKKTININPDLLSMSKKRSGGGPRTKKVRPTPLISPNVMKRNLLQKIKEHRERGVVAGPSNTADATAFSSEFSDSMDYLKQVKAGNGVSRKQSLFRPSPNIVRGSPMQQTPHYPPPHQSQPHQQYQEQPHHQSHQQYQQQEQQYYPPPHQPRPAHPHGYHLPHAPHVPHAPSHPSRSPLPTPRNNHNKSLRHRPPVPEQLRIKTDYEDNSDYSFAPVELEFPQEHMITSPFDSQHNDPVDQTSLVPQMRQQVTHTSDVRIPEVPYGCLKNGMKPTYRSWMKKTQKLSNVALRNVLPPREEELDRLRVGQDRQSAITEQVKRGGGARLKNKYLIKRTRRRKYKLGKSKHNRTISVLIKGTTMRNKIVREKIGLDNKSINDVKNYLKKHGLLKSGSSCPDDVVRKMYESAILTGYVKNTSRDVMLHNFLND